MTSGKGCLSSGMTGSQQDFTAWCLKDVSMLFLFMTHVKFSWKLPGASPEVVVVSLTRVPSLSDCWPSAPQTGRTGLSDSGPALRWLCWLQRQAGMLLFWKSHKSRIVSKKAVLSGQPVPYVAGEHGLRCQHPSSVLQGQLQKSYRDQVNVVSTRRTFLCLNPGLFLEDHFLKRLFIFITFLKERSYPPQPTKKDLLDMLHRVIYRKVNKTQPWLETGEVVGKSVAHTRNFPKGRHIKCQVNGRDHKHSRIQVEGCLGWSKRASFWKYLGA